MENVTSIEVIVVVPASIIGAIVAPAAVSTVAVMVLFIIGSGNRSIHGSSNCIGNGNDGYIPGGSQNNTVW